MSLFHRHRWERVSAEAFVEHKTWGGETVSRTTKTLVLYRCSCCDRLKTQELEGNWASVDIPRGAEDKGSA